MPAEWYRQSEGGSEEREAARTAAAGVAARAEAAAEAEWKLICAATWEAKKVRVAKRVAKERAKKERAD